MSPKQLIRELASQAIRLSPPLIINEICLSYYQPYYHLMYLLAQRSRYESTFVELGVEKGRGIACMAAGNPKVQVIGIDHTILPEVNVWLDKFPNLSVINQSSLSVPDRIQKAGKSIACLHIDTEHSYSMAKAEFEAYQPYLIDGALVLFDDLHAQEDGVLEYFNSLDFEKIQDDRLHPTCGYGIVLYEDDLA